MAVAAAVSSVRVWAYCVTEYQTEGSPHSGQRGRRSEIDQVGQGAHGGPPDGPGARPGPARRRLAPRRGMVATEREWARGTPSIQCLLRGNRVRRFKDVRPLPAPAPTVRLS